MRGAGTEGASRQDGSIAVGATVLLTLSPCSARDLAPLLSMAVVVRANAPVGDSDRRSLDVRE